MSLIYLTTYMKKMNLIIVDNIYFISFSGNVSFNTDLVETMNIYNTYDTVTAKELIDILSKRGIDNGNTKIQ